jgi:hypothetical protein
LNFSRKLRGLDSAIRTGAVRAMNKALTTAKTQLVRDLRSDTGLKTEVISPRVMAIKANAKKLTVSLNVAVKVGVPLRHFSPSPKKVKRGKRTYQGVTAKIGSQGRVLIPGAFLLDNVKGLVVVGRKKAFSGGQYVSPSGPRKPLFQLRTTAFQESAKARRDEAKAKLRNRFNDIVNHEIEFSIAQRLNQNK